MFDEGRFPAPTHQVTNVASVPHRSPFRYPGGKTWLVPEVRGWLRSLPRKPRLFCEPFCGGAIVGLSVLFEGLADELLLVELDDDVGAVWEVILQGEGKGLIDMIGGFQVSKEAVRAVLDRPHNTRLDHAFATILRNRVQRGGILASGASLMKRGENGRGLASRWYPRTLQQRIRQIVLRSSDIAFVHGDGIECIRNNATVDDAVFFIDPPYTVAGRRLYTHSEVDQEDLFRVVADLKGDFLMTYDDAQPIRRLAMQFGFDMQVVFMKNTHHRIMSELLVGRDLGWVRAEAAQFSQYPLLEIAQTQSAARNQAM